jgi:hypothetical protein
MCCFTCRLGWQIRGDRFQLGRLDFSRQMRLLRRAARESPDRPGPDESAPEAKLPEEARADQGRATQ